MVRLAVTKVVCRGFWKDMRRTYDSSINFSKSYASKNRY